MGGGASKAENDKLTMQLEKEKQEKLNLQKHVQKLEQDALQEKEKINKLTQQIHEQANQQVKQNQNVNQIEVIDLQKQGNQNDESSKHEEKEVKSSKNSNIFEQQQVEDQQQRQVQVSQLMTANFQQLILEEKQQQKQVKSQSEQIQESKEILEHFETSKIKVNSQQKNENENASQIQTPKGLTSNVECSNKNVETQEKQATVSVIKSQIYQPQQPQQPQSQIQQSQSQIQQSQSQIQQSQSQILQSQFQQQQQQQSQYQQQQQQQKSFIIDNDTKYQQIKSQINDKASKIIQEKTKSQFLSKSTKQSPKLQLSLKSIMESLIMIGKLVYKTQAYYDVFEIDNHNNQYRMKYINELIQMINMNLILFDEIGLNEENSQQIRNQIQKMLDTFLSSHQFHSQIVEQIRFLQNYCAKPELKQIDSIQYDCNIPMISESESLLEQQFFNLKKLEEDYKNNKMEALDVEIQENPFLVCEMVKFKDDFYTKVLDEAKRIKDKMSFNSFILKLQNQQNQDLYIHFSTFLRLFNNFFNQKNKNWPEELKKYCDTIKEKGQTLEVAQILIEYTKLGHKYCFQYLYTAIFYLQNEEQQNSSQEQFHKYVNQLDQI